MQTDLWKITCEEHLYPGLWQRWFRSQCVALGWPPQDGFHLDGTGVQGLGWTIARNALNRMKEGDYIFVTIQGNRVSRLGTITQLGVRDSEWHPFVPPSRTVPNGEVGRRIHVKWDLEIGPEDREYVVALPPEFRLTGAQLRTTLARVTRFSVQALQRVLNDQSNWVRLWANFDYERALSGYIAAFPHRLEDGLLPYPLEKTRERRGRGRTRMDVLLVDEVGTPVVVECKQDAPTLGHLQQLRAYMAQVRKDIGKVPRGILVHGGARKLRSEVRIARNSSRGSTSFNTISMSSSHDRRKADWRWRAASMDARMRACRSTAESEHAAAAKIGNRASEGSASTSVNAFELRRISSDVLSRVTDAASRQLIVDAPA